MPKIDITRTELVWPGKYDDEGNLVPPRRVSLPFQVIERVNETRATRAQHAGHVGTLFDYWQADEQAAADPGDGWRNKLIWGDNLYVMGSLLERFAGKIDLIYIDPPFATGADFSITAEIGEKDEELGKLAKQQSVIEEKAYRDTWGGGTDSYLKMIYDRLVLLRELLSERGSLYVHLDWHLCHSVKVLLDEIFGQQAFRNEIVREKCNPKNYTSDQFGNIHDVIFFYSKTDNPIWNRVYAGRSEAQIEKDFPQIEADTGRRYKTAPLHAPGKRSGVTGQPWKGVTLPPDYHWRYVHPTLDEMDATGQIEWSSTGNPRKKVYADESEGYAIQDIWLGFKDPGQNWYATEKPESLLDRIIKSSSDPGSMVADFFCGSGTTLAVTEKLGRHWIGCDLGRYAIHTARKRLMDIPNCKPFEILNLGKYERQVWQGVTFAGQRQTQQMLVFEYLKFILELYSAQPLAGTQHLHGKKGAAMVHVGAVDAPVTIDEVNACLTECKAMGQRELHVLGWEWEMGINNLMPAAAKAQGIKLVPLTIPREVMEQQAVQKGDIRFYELAYLEAKVEVKAKDHSATVTLTDFVIPNDELIPPEVRAKIGKWSDYVDYWAVDWDFRDDTFVNGWTSYRTRRDRTLQLRSESHTYPAAGTYRALVKVIDIFGNDTSQAYEVKVA